MGSDRSVRWGIPGGYEAVADCLIFCKGQDQVTLQSKYKQSPSAPKFLGADAAKLTLYTKSLAHINVPKPPLCFLEI